MFVMGNIFGEIEYAVNCQKIGVILGVTLSRQLSSCAVWLDQPRYKSKGIIPQQ